MIDVSIKIYEALKELKVPCTYIKAYDKNADIYVTYFVVMSIPNDYSDDYYTCINHDVQVDVWSKFEATNADVVNEIIVAMENAGFCLTNVRADLYENDTDIVHKPLEFRFIEIQEYSK